MGQVPLGRRVLNPGEHVMKGSLGSVVGVVLIGAVVACADVPVVPYSQDVESASLLFHRQRDIVQPVPAAEPARPVRQAIPNPNLRDPLNMMLGVGAVRPAMDFSTPSPPGRKTIVLPADLSSITMFLTGFASLGAWQFVRSARNGRFHFGHMPEWYHSGGPTQVGHVVALDLQNQTPIFCRFDRSGGNPTLAYSLRRVIHMRRKSQFMLTPAAPRGPPLRTW